MKETYENNDKTKEFIKETCPFCGTIWEDLLAMLTCPCRERYKLKRIE